MTTQQQIQQFIKKLPKQHQQYTITKNHQHNTHTLTQPNHPTLIIHTTTYITIHGTYDHCGLGYINPPPNHPQNQQYTKEYQKQLHNWHISQTLTTYTQELLQQTTNNHPTLKTTTTPINDPPGTHTTITHHKHQLQITTTTQTIQNNTNNPKEQWTIPLNHPQLQQQLQNKITQHFTTKYKKQLKHLKTIQKHLNELQQT